MEEKILKNLDDISMLGGSASGEKESLEIIRNMIGHVASEAEKSGAVIPEGPAMLAGYTVGEEWPRNDETAENGGRCLIEDAPRYSEPYVTVPRVVN